MIVTFMALAGVITVQTARAPASSCGVAPPAIVSRSPSGLAQVSNLALLHVRALVSPPRPVPAGGVLQSLGVEATVYQIAADGTRTLVPSSVNSTGAGADTESEYVSFTLEIPIAPSERDAAVRDYVAELVRAAASSTSERERAMASTLQATGGSAFAQMFRQHRTGRFAVDCRVLDGGRPVATASGEFEVLFKGRFFDQAAFRVK